MLLLSSLLCSLLVLRKISAQTLFHDGQLFANNSVIYLSEIGEGDLALKCHTTLPRCCKTVPRGEWYFPNGDLVPIRGANQDFYRNRDDSGNVNLNRRNGALSPRGGYYCMVPNNRGVQVRVQVAIYLPQDYSELEEQPQSQLLVDPGSNVSFTLTGQRISSHLWYHGNDPISPPNPAKYQGERSGTLTILNVQKEDEGMYKCVVSNTILSVLSDTAELTLLPPPTLVRGPVDALEVSLGSNVSFTVQAAGMRLGYRWQRADDPLLPTSEDARFVGVSTSTLIIHDIRLEDGGLYVCVVSNGAGTARSEGARLTITLGSEQEITSLEVTTAITSARLTWTGVIDTSPSSSLVYELQYFPSAFPSHTVTLNTTLTLHEVTRLIPQLRYEFRVRVFTSVGHGDWISESVLLERKIPAIRDLRIEITNSTNVNVSWISPEALPGWNISHYYLTYRANLPDKVRPEASFRRIVAGDHTSTVLRVAELVVREGVIHQFEVIPALVISGVEGIGEVKGEKSTINSTLDYEKLPFQVVIGPVQYCIDWEADRASRIEKTLQEAVVAVVSARCNCLFSLSSLSSGVFSCRGSRNVVAYRSFILGLNATALIGHVRDWVSTNTTIVIDWHLVDVYSACPVGLSKLYEPDCQLP